MNLRLVLGFTLALVHSGDSLSQKTNKPISDVLPEIINKEIYNGILNATSKNYTEDSCFNGKAEGVHPGVYYLRDHSLLKLIVDLLIDWECHTKLTLVIIDPKSGFTPSDLRQSFQTKPQYNCQMRFLSISDNRDNLCALVTGHRYIIVIGEEPEMYRILLDSKCPSLFLTFHTWILINSRMPLFIYDSELFDYINPWQSQLTILIPKNTIITSAFQANACVRRQNQLKTNLYSKYETLNNVEIFDVFYSNLTSKPEILMFANWSHSNGLYYLDSLAENRHVERMLRGRLVRLTTILIYPYTILDDNITTVIDGILYDLFNTIQRHLNVNHQIEVSKDHTFGEDINGSVTGFLGVLQRGESDVSLCLSAIREVRLKAVRYGFSLGSGYIQMVLKRPTATIPLTVYVQSFQPLVWLTVLGALVVVLLSLALTSIFTPHNALIIDRLKRTKRLVYYIISGEFIELAFDRPPGWSSKVIHYTLLTSTLMTFVYYCSIFTSLLAVTEVKLPFKTFEELVDRNDYKILTVKGSFIALAFEHSLDGVFKKIWQKFLTEGKKGLVGSFLEGLRKTLTGKYAFAGEGVSTKALALSKSSCQFVFTPTKYLKENYHVSFRRDFPYWKLYTHSLIRFKEGGIMNRQERIYLKESGGSCDDKVSLSLNIYHVFTLFFLLSLAFILVALVLTVERIYYAITNRHRHFKRFK